MSSRGKRSGGKKKNLGLGGRVSMLDQGVSFMESSLSPSLAGRLTRMNRFNDSSNRYPSSDNSGGRTLHQTKSGGPHERTKGKDPLEEESLKLARQLQDQEDRKQYESDNERVCSPARRGKREKEPSQYPSSHNDYNNNKKQKRSSADESSTNRNFKNGTKQTMTMKNTVDLCDSGDETDNSDGVGPPSSTPKRKLSASPSPSASAINGTSKLSKIKTRSQSGEEEKGGQYDDADEQQRQPHRRQQKQKRHQTLEGSSREPPIDLTTPSTQERHSGDTSNRHGGDEDQNHELQHNKRMIPNPWEEEKSSPSKVTSQSSSSRSSSASASVSKPQQDIVGRRRSKDHLASKEQMKKASTSDLRQQRESAEAAALAMAKRTNHASTAEDDDEIDFVGSLYGQSQEEEEEKLGFDSSFGNEDEDEFDSDKAVNGNDKIDNDSPREKESSGRGRRNEFDGTGLKSVTGTGTKRSRDLHGRHCHDGGMLGKTSRITTNSQKLDGVKGITIPSLKGSQTNGRNARSTGPSKKAPKGTSIPEAENIESSHFYAANTKPTHTSSQDANDDMGHPRRNEERPGSNLFASNLLKGIHNRSRRVDNDDNEGSTLRLKKQNHAGTSASVSSINKNKKKKGTPIKIGASINQNPRENGYRQTSEMTKEYESTSGENGNLPSGIDCGTSSKSCKEKQSSGSVAYDCDDDFLTTNDDMTFVDRRSKTRRSKASAALSTASDSDNDFETTNDDMTFVRSKRRSIRRRDYAAPSAANDSNDDFATPKDDTSRSLRSYGSRRTRSASRKKSSPEIVEIDSTDSEGETDEESEQKIDLKRLSWRREGEERWTTDGKECLVSFNEETNEITLHSKKIKNGPVKFSLDPSFRCMRVSHFGADALQTLANDGQSDPSKQDREYDHQGKLFIELSYVPSNFENIVSSPERKHGTDESTFSIVLDFVDRQDYDSLVESISPHIVAKEELLENVVDFFNQTNRQTRQKKNFGYKRDKEDVILVYPFLGHRNYALDKTLVDGLAEEFQLVDNQAGATVSTNDQPRQRAHHLVVRMKDYNRLKPRKWLNDTLVDFYMQWLTRENDDIENSGVHIFTSHFYSTLRDEGTDSVQSWTEKKNINIFKKKLVFIPINESSHWSLCVLVNPGNVEDSCTNPKKEYSCMLFMDSLRMHDSNDIKKNIYRWLNNEWNRLKSGNTSSQASSSDEPNVFYRKSFPCISPEVPRQRNGCDCGVFVCRYAYGVYRLAGLSLTQSTVMSDDGVPFGDLIHRDQELFNFDGDTIKNMREHFMVLLSRLSGKYKEYLDSKESVKQEKKKPAIDPQDDTTEGLNCITKTDLEDSGRAEMATPTGNQTLALDTSDNAGEERNKDGGTQHDEDKTLEQDMDNLEDNFVGCSLTNGCEHSPDSKSISAEI